MPGPREISSTFMKMPSAPPLEMSDTPAEEKKQTTSHVTNINLSLARKIRTFLERVSVDYYPEITFNFFYPISLSTHNRLDYLSTKDLSDELAKLDLYQNKEVEDLRQLVAKQITMEANWRSNNFFKSACMTTGTVCIVLFSSGYFKLIYLTCIPVISYILWYKVYSNDKIRCEEVITKNAISAQKLLLKFPENK